MGIPVDQVMTARTGFPAEDGASFRQRVPQPETGRADQKILLPAAHPHRREVFALLPDPGQQRAGIQPGIQRIGFRISEERLEQTRGKGAGNILRHGGQQLQRIRGRGKHHDSGEGFLIGEPEHQRTVAPHGNATQESLLPLGGKAGKKPPGDADQFFTCILSVTGSPLRMIRIE